MNADSWKITNNGHDFLSSAQSLELIYNNITGRNIYGVLYYKYLCFAKSQGLESGEVALIHNDKILLTDTVIIKN